MSIFSRFSPVATALLPNAEFDDIKLVLKLFLPWNWNKWRKGKEISELENKFKEYFGVKYAISFSSGRVGLYAILKSISNSSNSAFGVQRSEIILQAYTTIALPLAIQKAGFRPVYVDIKKETYNIDPDKIEAKITANTKAIIVQHTFGIPAEMDKITEICRKHNLILIEDCAHSLGAEFGGKKVGAFGDAAFFSFGRDKIISSASGGLVITNDSDLAVKIKEFQNSLSLPPRKWIFRQLAHPLVFWCSLPIYYFFNLGKYFIFFAQKLGLIIRAYSKEERAGIVDEKLLYKLPNALAILILNQFEKLERFNEHRQKLAEIYQNCFHYGNMYYHSETETIKKSKEFFHFDTPMYQSEKKTPGIPQDNKPTFLYYTIQMERRDELLKFAAKNHIILGDWFPGALGPRGIDPEKFGYKKGDCPVAEKVGLESINLPTNIKMTESDAKKIVNTVKIAIGKINKHF